MQIFMAAVLLLLGMSSAVAEDAEQTEQTVGTFVFVGELISIEELPDPCEQKQKETGVLSCINMDALYRARYRVVLPVAGTYSDTEITFGIADHYGFPPFAYTRNALLFVGLYEDGPWLHKYQAIAVHRTSGGQWASCGEVEYREKNDPAPSLLRSLDYETGIEPAGNANDPGWIKLVSRWKEYGRQDYEMKNGRILCKRGILLPDAYEIVRNGVMKARGIPLPALRSP